MSDSHSLSLDQAPPISVPMRFFVTAPLFALSAALFMLWRGADSFSNRWDPTVLGITHLLTLGYMGLIMVGAIMQMLPVVAGTPMRKSTQIANVVHVMATIGIFLLCFGLIFTQPLVLKMALPTLGVSLLLFAFMVFKTLRRSLPQNVTARAMRMAVLMFAASVLLGLTLLSNHAFGWWLGAREGLADLHLTLGLLGWVGILIVSVAYQVVPMFQLTPNYPTRLTRWLAPALFGLLLTLAIASQWPMLRCILGILLAAGYSIFALTTLRLQQQRRRKLPDVSLNFWRGGLISLLLAVTLWLVAQSFPVVGSMASYSMLLGALMIVGFAMSIINGMLYKIVPFLVWFHLKSRRGPKGVLVPNVREIMPESRTRPQMWLHFAGLGALLAAIVAPTVFIYPSALLLAVSNLWLWLNIVAANRIYVRVDSQLRQTDGSVG